MIPAFFYTYTEVLENEHNLTYDIITFILSVIIGVFVWLSTCKFKIAEFYTPNGLNSAIVNLQSQNLTQTP